MPERYSEPWSVYQCQFVYGEDAEASCCGLEFGDGQIEHWTDSREECGHAATKNYVQRACDCVNAMAGIDDPAAFVEAARAPSAVAPEGSYVMVRNGSRGFMWISTIDTWYRVEGGKLMAANNPFREDPDA